MTAPRPALKATKKQKPFIAWMLYDANDVYEPTLHWRRNSAESDKRMNADILDAKWRICRVRVKAV